MTDQPFERETIDWIDASEEVPDDDRVVLIFWPTGDYPVWPGYYNNNETWVTAEGDELADEDVKAWAEMPDGPGTEEADDDGE